MSIVGKRNVIYLWIGITLFSCIQVPLKAQTCCSGGVPLSGNMGFMAAARGTLQMEMSYDVNYLNRLLMGSELVLEENRTRLTQSILLKAGYSQTDHLAVDALFSYVHQSRSIHFKESVRAT